MKLTEKDLEFLRQLQQLMQSRDLEVQLKCGKPSHMVLTGTYGGKIHKTFHVTRQGVRWRFQRIFNDMYVSAFMTILTIERTFGSGLREHAVRISKERYELRHEMGLGGRIQHACHGDSD
ncbi:MAG: hypothetical protein D8M59_07570 [Planctomycetes bacterium]|nr:hypothetical protein [Planctomycetota bacterium]NOG53186.1 hypothetical protein [Planctomycetota bacterium]